MAALRKLASQTALYGLSSILGRVLNFLLVPLHTAVLSREEYGQNTYVYSLIAFLIVLLTYGFETAFFKFTQDKRFSRDSVYATGLKSLLVSTALFTVITLIFISPISGALRYSKNPDHLVMMVFILAMDTIAALPFAKLRAENRVGRFVLVKMVLISTNILFNLYFFWLAPLMANAGGFLKTIADITYSPEYGVGYVFLANVLSSLCMLLMLLPQMSLKWLKVPFHFPLWKEMFGYGWPLMVAGFAGVANEMLDRQFIKFLLPKEIADAELGIYGAVYKLSMFLVLFNQAFRYAAEPFFFSTENNKDAPQTFARVMNIFVMVLTFGFVFILVFLPVLRYFIDQKFWIGLHILPILLGANVFLGINTTLSVWYKLLGKTRYGMRITYIGFAFTLVFNLWLIPILGYEGAAWATLVSYIAMTVVSYYLGQKHYPIPYHTKKILLSLLCAALAGFLTLLFANVIFAVNLIVLAVFCFALSFIYKSESKQIVNLIKQKIWK